MTQIDSKTIRRKKISWIVGGLGILILVPAWTLCAQAQSTLNFQNKTINIVVGFAAGGGYDADARLVGRYMGAYLRGNPTVVVRNMPGAGGLVAMNYLYNAAPRDGLTMGVVAPSVAAAQLLQLEENIKYDVREANWIGRITSNDGVLISWPTGKFQSVKDAQKQEIAVAGTGPTSDSVIVPRLLNEFINTKFKIVPGYSGTGPAQLAFERGEVDAFSMNWSNVKSEHADWLRDKKVIIALQTGLKRNSELRDVPTAVEWGLNDEQRQILSLFASSGAIGVALVGPPKINAALVEDLRASFNKTMADQNLIKEAESRQMDIDPLPGADLQKICDQDFSISPKILAEARRLVWQR